MALLTCENNLLIFIKPENDRVDNDMTGWTLGMTGWTCCEMSDARVRQPGR